MLIGDIFKVGNLQISDFVGLLFAGMESDLLSFLVCLFAKEDAYSGRQTMSNLRIEGSDEMNF